MRSCTAILSMLLTLLLSGSSRAAPIDPAEVTISILIFGPGAPIEERFGHIAIRVRDEARGFDNCYDWGNFAFTPGFVFTFLSGDLQYWMAENDAKTAIQIDAFDEDRTVIEQTLNLDSDQKRAMLEVLRTGLSAENRTYRYDYYIDNCSTRVRDALDKVTASELRKALAVPTPYSLRWHTRRLMPVGGLNTICETLADIAAGPRTDHPLTKWETAFIPMEFANDLDTIQITHADGTRGPLVSDRKVINTTHLAVNADPATAWNPMWATLPISLVLAALLLVFARIGSLGFRLAATMWELFVTFGALLLPGMALLTFHWAVAWNQNLLQFTPLSLFVLAAIWRNRWRAWLRWASVGSVALSGIGALVTISHLTIQQNAPAIALALPLHVAVMIGLRGQGTGVRGQKESEDLPSSPLTSVT